MLRKKQKQRGKKESVLDYPRPPKVEDSEKHIRVVFNGVTIAETNRAKRVLETSHPPVYYTPLQDVRVEHLSHSDRKTFCEWKGAASYYNVEVKGKRAKNAAWYYPEPKPGYAELKNYVAFYPQLMEACTVNGEKVQPQPGSFYGGWITSDIEGPFKGGPGSMGW